MSGWFDSWFGGAPGSALTGQALHLTVTDDDLSISWIREAGFGLAREGWDMPSAGYKSGGIFGNNALADGQILKHFAFDNVVEQFRFALHFSNTNNMLDQIDELEELLTIRAPEYWLFRRRNPVRLERRLEGESSISYMLVNYGLLTKTVGIVSPWLEEIGHLQPLMVQINRRPFVLGGPPGRAQRRASIYALQAWDFNKAWAEETTLPSGSIFSFAELANSDIYAGGASEILYYTSSTDTWSVASTSPITLSGDVTAAIRLSNGDMLFGENGRILKLSGGAWSEETALPSGQVWAIVETNNSVLYAADNGQILKRNAAGTWAVDSTLPGGQIYSLVHASSGRTFAGGAGEILRTVTPTTTTEYKRKIQSGNDDAEQRGSTMDLNSGDLDFFDSVNHWVGLRFTDVTIPQGATILSAVVRFRAEDTDGGTAGTAQIYCQDTDDAAAFSSSANDISSRTLTTATTTWTEIPSWSRRSSYDTADFTAAVQEVVDRPGWSSGNALAVIFDITATGRDRDAISYDKNAADAPEVIITYAVLTTATAWEVASTLPSGNVRSAAECGGAILFGGDGEILGTDDDGNTFGVVDSSTPTGEMRALITAGGTVMYAGDNGNILKSADCGNNWIVDSTLPTGYIHALLYGLGGVARAGDSGRILKLTSETFELGQEATSVGDVPVANKHNEAQLTHIYHFDNSSGIYNSLYPAAFPLALFSSQMAVGLDALYFGIDTGLSDSGPFSSLIFDIVTAAASTGNYDGVWQYWNGSWSPLVVQDDTGKFQLVGKTAVAWELPADWVTTAVNGVTGYWVRFYVNNFSGTFTNPVQQTRDVYTAVTPYLELDSSQTLGVIDSLAQLQARNIGTGGSSPALKTNRLLIGSKPVAGFESFRAFLNFADEQHPNGVSVSTAVDGDSATSVVASLAAPTGRAVFFDASSATLDSLVDRVSITLATTVAGAYAGQYRAFVRGRQSGGSAGEIKLRLKTVTGSGGISSLTDIQATKSTQDHELIEFEEIVRIPVSSQFASSELGNETSITLQIEAAENDADFYAYDLFLLPVDYHYIDAQDAANTADSAAGQGERITIDSISVPRLNVRGQVEKVATGLVKATYEVASNGPFQVTNKIQQRLWFLAAQYQAPGTNVWLSKPEALHNMRLWLTDRWLTGRGSA